MMKKYWKFNLHLCQEQLRNVRVSQFSSCFSWDDWFCESYTSYTTIKLGLITVCCIISVKLTVVWNITGVWPFWLVGASLFESDIDWLFILFVSKSDSESDVYLRNRFGSGVTLSWSLLLLIIVCKLFVYVHVQPYLLFIYDRFLTTLLYNTTKLSISQIFKYLIHFSTTSL